MLLTMLLTILSTSGYALELIDKDGYVVYDGIFTFKKNSSALGSINYDLTLIKVDPDNAMIPYPSTFTYGYIYNVVAVGDAAYAGSTSVERIGIPEGVKSIGRALFSDCPNLRAVVFPKSLNTIADDVFLEANISELRVNWSEPLSLSSNPFQGLESSITLYVPKGTSESYRDAAVWQNFKEIIEIGSDDSTPMITFKDQEVKEICVENWDTNADRELSEAEAAAVLSLNGVFRNNHKITSFDELRYFTGLTCLGEREFNDCINLESVTLPNSLIRLQYNCLRDCFELQTITIPEKLNFVDPYAFEGSGLDEVQVAPDNTTFTFKRECQCLVDKVKQILVWGRRATKIPDGIVEIGEAALEHNAAASLTIPSSVKRIANRAFWGCDLTSLILPEGVESIGNYAFAWCGALQNVSLPSTLKTIGNATFDHCASLTSIEIPGSVTETGWGVFSNCEKLVSVTLNNGLKTLGSDMFVACEALTSVKIPASVTKIEGHLFRLCSALTSVIVDENNQDYDSRENCNAIIETASNTFISGCSTSFIPKKITTIGYYAFGNLQNLTSLTIPASVTTIESNMFGESSDPTYLTDLTVNWMNPVDFRGCEGKDFSKTTLHVPAGTAIIYKTKPVWKTFGKIVEFGDNSDGSVLKTSSAGVDMYIQVISEKDKTCRAFNLKTLNDDYYPSTTFTAQSVTIPETLEGYTVTEIGEWLFAKNTNITSVELPASITAISQGAFIDCENLKSLTVNALTPPSLGDIVFAGLELSKIELIVPDEAKEAYAAAEEWRDFSTEVVEDDGYGSEFTYTNADGIVMYFTVISKSKKTCKIGRERGQWGMQVPWNFQGAFTVPDVVNGYKVVEILPFAFGANYGITKINLPNTIETIDNNAFSICYNLASIEIPASVKSIGFQLHGNTKVASITVDPNNPVYDSRNNCNAIIRTSDNKLVSACRSTVIPDNVEIIGESSYYWFDGLETVNIPNSVKTIEKCAFQSVNMTSVIMPNSVKKIGSQTFASCKKLESLKLSENLTVLPDWFIRGCENLRSLTIPKSVKTIEVGAFQESGLTSLEIPEGVVEIGEFQFYNSPNLTYVTFPASMKSLGVNPFQDCPSLEMVKVADGSRYYKSIGNKAILEQETGKLVAYINDGTTLRIPDGVKRIGSSFLNTSSNQITSMILPESIEEIGFNLFKEFSNLSTLRVLSKEPAEVSWSFNDDSSLTEEEKKYMAAEIWYRSIDAMISKNGTTLFVPTGCTDAYKQNPFWEVFFRYGDDQVKEIEPVKGDFSGTGTVDAEDVVTFVGDFIDKGADNLDPDKYDLTEDGKVDKNDLMAMIYLACGYTYNKEAGRWIWTNPISGSRMTLVELTEMLQAKFAGSGAENMLTGISKVVSSGDANVKIYNLKGQPSEQLRKGLNIVRDANGRVRKVFVK